MPEAISLGLDTGGTYTDAVLYGEKSGVLASAKALTTRHDLTIGLREAADAVIAQAGLDTGRISLVSLSTTLATNALVEGQGGRAGLVMIGFAPEDLARGGLAEAVGDGPTLMLAGGHDVHGAESPLDAGPLEAALDELAETVDAFAVCGYFAVRNPAHEIAVRDIIRSRTGLPVTCSHELSARLGGPRRALTTVLNARLIAMLDRLVSSSAAYLAEREIDAPLMVVRGDGALVSAQEARLRPIETILSGPAASLVGARHLTGLDCAVVADIGGTTTDIAVMEDGEPRLDREGAIVGGHRTMVEAVAVSTYGLGGDSEVHFDPSALEAVLALGPKRRLPLSLAAHHHGDVVVDALRRQAQAEFPGRLDGLFALRFGPAAKNGLPLAERERELWQRLSDTPAPLDTLLSGLPERSVLDRLVARGLATIAAFTPSDAMHVLGRQSQWNAEAARLGAEIMARRKDGRGRMLASSAQDLAEMVVERLTLRSARCLIAASLAAEPQDDRPNAMPIDPETSPVIARALTPQPGIVGFHIAFDRPVVALGASAGAYYPKIAGLLNAQCVVPPFAEVANAVGAVVGHVRTAAGFVVTRPDEERFAVAGPHAPVALFATEEAALAHARLAAETEARADARRAGAGEVAVTLIEKIAAPEVDGRRSFIEAVVTATAMGRPRLRVAETDQG